MKLFQIRQVIKIMDDDDGDIYYVHLDKISSVRIDADGDAWVNLTDDQKFFTGATAKEFLRLYEQWLEKEDE